MLCFRAQVLIETKAPGKAHPSRPGSKPGETQQEQMERYLRALVPRSQTMFGVGWRGFLTDGRRWWGWTWDNYGQIAYPLPEIQGRVAPKSPVDFEAFVKSALGATEMRGLVPPPENLTEILFAPLLDEVREIQLAMEDRPEYLTKFGLWANLLEGSGIAPPAARPMAQHEAFAKHTILVTTARILVDLLGEPSETHEDLVVDGFHGWLAESSDGRELLHDLAKRVSGYDWRGTEKDVLKSVYHRLIDPAERKVFGEFYTPDDLARRVVLRVLDGDWCDREIRRAAAVLAGGDDTEHLGLLDPACGSGTFLFHAARHLCDRVASDHIDLMPQTAEIVAMLVHGVDVHPVATEMSRATLAMALPQSTDSVLPHLRIVLGDAMRPTATRIERGMAIRVQTPANRVVLLPSSIALHSGRSEIVRQVVVAATGGEDLALDASSFGTEIVSEAEKLHGAMASVIDKEGNHVWNWLLLNSADLFSLEQRGVSRLIGNPPWLVSPSTPEGERKNTIEAMRAEEGVMPERKSSARGDLASVFTARVTRLYLSDEDGLNRYGWVLPGSAIINQAWGRWREGRWTGVFVRHEQAWNLDDVEPPIFPHAPNGTCVVFGQRSSNPSDGIEETLLWEGPLETATVRPLVKRPSIASTYVRSFRIGALSKPQPLLLVVAKQPTRAGLVKVQTKLGTKQSWRGIQLTGTVEEQVLLSVVRSQEVKPFSVEPKDVFLLAPRVEGELVDVFSPEGAERFPHCSRFWRKADRIYRKYRTENARPTLLENLDYNGTLSSQLAYWDDDRRRKVTYNASGVYLRATRVPASAVTNQKTYWAVLDSEDEALYLCGVLNAHCLRGAWQEGRTSKLDFDKSPWRHVPVPVYDQNERHHLSIVEITRSLEATPTSARWLGALDEAVRRVIPDYAE